MTSKAWIIVINNYLVHTLELHSLLFLKFRIPGTSTFCNSDWKSSKQKIIVIDKNFELLPHSVPEEEVILEDGP